VDELCERVRDIDLGQRLELLPGVWVTALRAGHVLGACGFLIEGGGASVVYTGDFSVGANHHLTGECFNCLRPSVMVTESTYGNVGREPIWKRQKAFLQTVHRVVRNGGRVLVPVFAIGRLQELCLMLNDFWERMGLKEPIFVASGMGTRANDVYKGMVRWMNETVRDNLFDEGKVFLKLDHVQRLPVRRGDQSAASQPCVVLATAGMLNAGPSFHFLVTEKWCEDPKNLLLFAGYQSEGTLGRAILDRVGPHVRWRGNAASEFREVELNVQCQVETVSFSAHGDRDEICRVIRRVQPRRVVTIHGSVQAVEGLAEAVGNIGIPSEAARLGWTIDIAPHACVKIRVDESCIEARGRVVGELARVDDSQSVEMGVKWQIRPSARRPRTFALRRRIACKLSFDDFTTVFRKLHPDAIVDTELSRVRSAVFSSVEYLPGFLYINHDGRHNHEINRLVCCLAR
jgi:integrator complex subunit 11